VNKGYEGPAKRYLAGGEWPMPYIVRDINQLMAATGVDDPEAWLNVAERNGDELVSVGFGTDGRPVTFVWRTKNAARISRWLSDRLSPQQRDNVPGQ
jgi:hypothetical protein